MPTFTVTVPLLFEAATAEEAREKAVDYFRSNYASAYPMRITQTFPLIEEDPEGLEDLSAATRARWEADKAEAYRLGFFTVQAYRNAVSQSTCREDDTCSFCHLAGPHTHSAV
jgi:hypothetical protein